MILINASIFETFTILRSRDYSIKSQRYL